MSGKSGQRDILFSTPDVKKGGGRKFSVRFLNRVHWNTKSCVDSNDTFERVSRGKIRNFERKCFLRSTSFIGWDYDKYLRG